MGFLPSTIYALVFLWFQKLSSLSLVVFFRDEFGGARTKGWFFFFVVAKQNVLVCRDSRCSTVANLQYPVSLGGRIWNWNIQMVNIMSRYVKTAITALFT